MKNSKEETPEEKIRRGECVSPLTTERCPYCVDACEASKNKWKMLKEKKEDQANTVVEVPDNTVEAVERKIHRRILALEKGFSVNDVIQGTKGQQETYVVDKSVRWRHGIHLHVIAPLFDETMDNKLLYKKVDSWQKIGSMFREEESLNLDGLFPKGDPEVLGFLDYLRESIGHKPQCMMVYFMLNLKFPDAIPYSDNDHIITKIKGAFYDWGGAVIRENHIPFQDSYGDEWIVNHYNAIRDKFKKIK